jgi:hypothetical protein
MTFTVQKIENFAPEAFFGLLHRKHLLTLPVRNNPGLLVPIVLEGDFHAICEGDRVAAYLIETRTYQEGTLDLSVIPEDKTLCLHREELAGLSEELRNRWFATEGWSKVQSSVAKSRQNTRRTLAALGFVCETRSLGIRQGITLGKEPEPLMIYGLIPTDPIPDVSFMKEAANA